MLAIAGAVKGGAVSTLQETAQKLQVIRKLAVAGHQFLDLADAVHDRRVVTPAKAPADLGLGPRRQLLGQIHRHLTRPRNVAHPLGTDHIG